MTTDSGEFTCRELVEVVTDYLEGALAPADRVLFEQHLAYCDACTNYLQQMRHTLDVLGALSEESIQEPARQELLTAFRNWKRTRKLGTEERAD